MLTLPDLPDQQITLGSPFSTTAVAAGGDGKYKYTASGLPIGVTIDARSGAVTGLPAVPGRYVPTITVADGSGAMATDTFVLLVHTRTALTFTAPVADQKSPLNQPVNLPITTNAATLGNKGISLEAVGLPPGVKWNNGKDALVGTPTSAGTYLVTLTAASVMPVQTALLTFVWTVG